MRSTEDGMAREAPTSTELRAYVAVAEERHFSRAATRLRVATPSLSRTIRRLEARLGVVLLERSSRTVILTDAGEALLPRARDILERMYDAQVAVADAARVVSGQLVLGVFSNGFAELTGPIISAFLRWHPDVALTIRDMTENPLEMLLNGSVDVALIRPPIAPDDDERLRIIHMIAEPRCALLPTSHELADADDLSIEDILDYPFVSAIPQCPSVADHWAATDWRGGEPVRVGSDAFTVPDVLRAVSYLHNVVTAMPSLPRFIRVPGVEHVNLRDMPPTTMAVALRPENAANPLVADLTETARRVSMELADLVPGARYLRNEAEGGLEALRPA